MNFDIAIIKSESNEVSSIVVMDGTRTLMGQRKDNQKWTTPGGHLEDGEDPSEGMARELFEESGIKLSPSELQHLVDKKIVTPDGKKLIIHAYKYDWGGEKPTVKNDPDKEVKRWEWIETKNGLPENILENLHSPKHVGFKHLGLIKTLFYVGEPMQKAHSLVLDLLKGTAGHKYIRKYQHGGKWNYIYYEAKGRPKKMSEQALGILKQMAELGDEQAKRLIEGAEDHTSHIQELMRHAHDGVGGGKRLLKEKYDIDHEREQIEAMVKPRNDKTEIEMSPQVKASLKKHLDEMIDKKTFGHLTSYSSSDLTKRTVTHGITKESLKEGVLEAHSMQEAMAKLHENLKKLDVAHAGLTSVNSFAKEEGYAGGIYNGIIKGLEMDGHLPHGYAELHKREKGRTKEFKMPKVADMERKAAERAAAEAEAERREAGELEGSMAYHMVSLAGLSGREKIRQGRELNTAIKAIFGSALTKEKWPYNFEGFTVKITEVEAYSEKIKLKMSIKDSEGRTITEGWTRTFIKGSDGRPHIENDFLKVASDARNGVQIASKINQAQRDLMKSLPNGGTIRVHANLDVGAYNWANQGFSWSSSTSMSYQSRFSNFLKGKGINLTSEQLNVFKQPAHFAAFTDGKKYLINTVRGTSIPLTELQKTTKSISGVEGKNTLTSSEISSGKTGRMMAHLGKIFMLDQDWTGTWDSAKNTPEAKFAEKYYAMKDAAVKFLGADYNNVLGFAAEHPAVTPERATPRGTTEVAPARSISVPPRFGTGTPDPLNGGQRRTMDAWSRNGTITIRITPQRIGRLMSWSDEPFEHFMRTSRLSLASRRALRQARNNVANARRPS